ncbi:hypothetical protein HG535_0F03150 [Zygotorulaspora mrakii]|uniref:assimilatory sulfite reductase (NADPH) n=1 Tax=Zygotorulaspora mrakii TaxID=42260 RepID=A0A7H9B665_ZYGMR|nr:uncharacterized protein HG535_0F03150 [Zygotorulaspora mrakii]QLG73804.1 hypothetical protein HG535_0F03150 [Zygotorulaspora mrakii]
MSMYSTNPFGVPSDPKKLPSYATPVSSISSVLYNNLKTIFTYKTFSEPDLLDSCLKQWSSRGVNSVFFRELDVRTGAGLAPLGFSHGSSAVTGIVAPGYALPYFVNSFHETTSPKDKFVFSVSSLNYDEESGAIVSDYVTPLQAASRLNFTVVTPVSASEVQAVTLLSLAIARFSRSKAAVNLYEGSYAKSVAEIREKISQDGLFDKLEKALPLTASFEDVLDKFNEFTNLKLHNFQYTGASDAETVFVTYGSLESQLFHDALVGNDSKSALIAVRVPLPFDLERFVAQIPSTARKIVVIGQSLDGNSATYLRSQVSAALFYHRRRNVSVSEYIYQTNFVWSPTAVEQVISTFIPEFVSSTINATSKGFTFWASDKSSVVDLSSRLVHALSLVDGQTITLRSIFDNIANAGTFQSQFTTGPVSENLTISNIDNADVAFVENVALLDTLDVTATVKNNGTILVISRKSLKELDQLKGETYVKDLGINEKFFVSAAEKNIKVVIIDAHSIGDKEETKGHTLSFVSQAVFWKYAFGYDVAESVRRIWSSAGPDIELLAAVLSDIITTAFEDGVKEVPSGALKSIVEDFSKKESTDTECLPIYVTETSFTPNQSKIEEIAEVETGKISDVTRKLVFKEAYGVENVLRPDLPVKNFVVKVKENRRVTPSDYDRYIFHIEFDISGAGLKYGIGEALGVHARNNVDMVTEFLRSYGLDENQTVLVPNKDDSNLLESRTVLQAFTDNLDIFGKPPKKFYESLVEFATNEDEKLALENLISPAGSVDLKRYQDVEYYTYADIFEKFPSARPSVEHLVSMIAPLKRREYSIASSQKVHENEVHLLIVVVDWVDAKGRKRFGQASKFLSELQVGSEVVVSVKPSVMKLPPNPKQPVIMSGLGTGLAPFKAIVEEKMWQKEQGHEIGEVYLFLGSRHKREEYLYGELWEAYKDAGIITHIGAAFSRDQPEKIYIQDRIKEALVQLKPAMIDKVGSFYLCGPTWPVPDITHALQEIISADAAEKGVKVDLNAAIEDLKEASRYILEVY